MLLKQCGRIPFQPEDKQTPPPAVTPTMTSSQIGHMTQPPGGKEKAFFKILCYHYTVSCDLWGSSWSTVNYYHEVSWSGSKGVLTWAMAPGGIHRMLYSIVQRSGFVKMQLAHARPHA